MVDGIMYLAELCDIWEGMEDVGKREASFCQVQCGFHCVELILTQCCPKWA